MIIVAKTQQEQDELFARIHSGELMLDPERAWLMKVGSAWAFVADESWTLARARVWQDLADQESLVDEGRISLSMVDQSKL